MQLHKSNMNLMRSLIAPFLCLLLRYYCEGKKNCSFILYVCTKYHPPHTKMCRKHSQFLLLNISSYKMKYESLLVSLFSVGNLSSTRIWLHWLLAALLDIYCCHFLNLNMSHSNPREIDDDQRWIGSDVVDGLLWTVERNQWQLVVPIIKTNCE